MKHLHHAMKRFRQPTEKGRERGLRLRSLGRVMGPEPAPRAHRGHNSRGKVQRQMSHAGRGTHLALEVESSDEIISRLKKDEATLGFAGV